MQHGDRDPAPFLNQSELARRWSVSLRTLENWRYRRIGPPFVKIGARVRYRLAQIEAVACLRDIALTEQGIQSDQKVQVEQMEVHGGPSLRRPGGAAGHKSPWRMAAIDTIDDEPRAHRHYPAVGPHRAAEGEPR